jgi:3'(2'), 5'-bisphosphate nucleotidase
MTESESVAADVVLASQLAEQAGRLLVALRTESGATGKELGALGDRQSNELIVRGLSVARPDDIVLSEESADDPRRLTADRVWIVDPLDGTREYAMGDRIDWAVHVALWQRGPGLTAAAVSEPAVGVMHNSGIGAPAPAWPADRLSILVSASRPPTWLEQVASALGAEVSSMGSAGAKTMAVLRGDYDAYLHDGGQWEWDSAAPVGVALAHGLHASRIDGSPLTYNRRDPHLPDLVICRPDRAPDILAAIANRA